MIGGYLDVPRPLVGLVSHLLFHAGELLFQICHLVLVQLGQVVQLFFESLVPEGERRRKTLAKTRQKRRNGSEFCLFVFRLGLECSTNVLL